MIERLHPDQIGVAGGEASDVAKFIEHDYRIRSGTCPNGCGLMIEVPGGQECNVCNFSCNIPSDKGSPQ